ncbi:MAG: hypothetical protein KAI55_00725 [Candidatus Aenigmarchaeota archaeon]|nr:hypothetical protein [Candidatus Aenigmarchaeota archaeon]
MANKCVKCGKVHSDEADYLIEGCDSCGSKFFFHINEEEEQLKNMPLNLTKKQINEIEKDARSFLKFEKNKVLVLSIEAIRIVSPGKYELDLVNLFNQTPLVIKIGEGKYRIDLSGLPKKKEK